MLIGREELESAALRIRPHLRPTPTVRSEWLSERVEADIFLKLELLQPTHSFKVRGAFNALLSLSPEKRRRGVVAASQGNHGLGVALAARRLDLAATIYLPEKAAPARIQGLVELGAEVVRQGDSWDAANREARRVAHATGRAYIHPFDDPLVIAGQGTVFLELLDQVPAVDLLVASIGGGGLLSGLACAARQSSPATRLVGVETVGSDCLHQSRRAGRLVELEAITSVATSLGARRSEPRPFQIIQELVSDLVVIPDAQAVEAVLWLLREEKLLTEPAAGCCVAALLHHAIPVSKGEAVVIVLCGGNLAPAEALDLAGAFGVAV